MPIPTIRDYDPTLGMAFQGDVAIVPIPQDINFNFRLPDELPPTTDHKLILQEGELTGHHHAIDLTRYPVIDNLMADALAHNIPLPSAYLYPTPSTVLNTMLDRGIITRGDLFPKLLVIKIGPMCLLHPEHDGIRIPPGAYLIGRQVEATAADERLVED